MLVECLRGKMHKITALRSSVLGYEYKPDGSWDIKNKQQILVESVNKTAPKSTL